MIARPHSYVRRRLPESAMLCCVLFAVVLNAQDPAPVAAPDAALVRAVDQALDEKDEARASAMIEAIAAKPEATVGAVIAALEASTSPLQPKMEDRVPYLGQHLVATILAPPGHSRDGPRLPVVLDISGGAMAAHWPAAGFIWVFVEGYTPPQFSDEARDGFLKILRSAAHRAHGDPELLWLTGFSWAGHASWDTAMHRPAWIRGIVPCGGAPRRQHFRLVPNLTGIVARSFTGAKDDPEMVWNLKELIGRAKAASFDYRLMIDPDAGHDWPQKESAAIPSYFRDYGRVPYMHSGFDTVVADGPLVESPRVRIDAVDPSKVKTPERVSVGAGASADEARRAQLKGMDPCVARLTTRRTSEKGRSVLAITEWSGVKAATLFLRHPEFVPGTPWIVRSKAKTLHDGPLSADVKTMLFDARRTGERLRPALRVFSIE